MGAEPLARALMREPNSYGGKQSITLHTWKIDWHAPMMPLASYEKSCFRHASTLQ